MFGPTIGLILGIATASLAQSTGYAPVLTTCPTAQGALLRTSGDVNADEASYVSRHRTTTASAWQTFLSAHDTGYNLNQLAPNASSWPVLGIAASGGGYRAALYAAGSMTAFDVRNTTSPVAGVLQIASYISGLSGGSWAVGSWAINSFPNPTQLVLGNASAGLNGWQLSYNLIVPGGTLGLIDNSRYYDAIGDQVQAKEDAGYNVSLTDPWGRALSYHFAPGTTADNFYESNATAHAANLNWNSFTASAAWQNAEVPLPLVVADSQPVMMVNGPTPYSTAYIPLNDTEYEFSPFEFGSHDAPLNAFINITHMGTRLTNGQPDNSTACVQGFQSFGFVIGTSSSLFNAIVATANSTLGQAESAILGGLTQRITGGLRDSRNDVANYPNSWYQLDGRQSWERYNNASLDLVDGGLNGENIPLGPLLVKARQVDTIIALDASADTNYNWPNATSLYATRDRIAVLNNGQSFPELPPNFTALVSAGLNTRPVFYGCNVSDPNTYPLIAYLPNAPTTVNAAMTNYSTFTLEYSNADASAFLSAVHANAAQLSNNTWPVCLSCAIVDRTRQRRGLPRSSTCESCFASYCYSDALLQRGIAANGGLAVTAARSAAVALSLPISVAALMATLAAAWTVS